MITGILIGVGAMVVLGVLVSLVEPEARRALAVVVCTVLAVPAFPFYKLIMWWADRQKGWQARTISREGFRRFVNSGGYRGLILHRRGRAYIVITDPQIWKKGRPAAGKDTDA